MKRQTKKANFVTFGNKKLPKSTMIFNMSTAKECPSRKLGLCQNVGICYALKAEIQYPAVAPFRHRQYKYYSQTSAYDISLDFCDLIAWKAKSKYPITAIRFSEAGDFASQDMVAKMTEVFKYIKSRFPNIAIYGYTARKDLNFTELMKYATIQGSGFMLSNQFQVVETIDTKKPYCCCDCKACNMCQFANGDLIQVKKH